MFLLTARCLLSLSVLSMSTARPSRPVFPSVDLGYATHDPTVVDTTESDLNIAKYNNIRFAEPPLGDLRFRKAKTPPPQEAEIQDGSKHQSTDCVSSAPAFLPMADISGTHWGQEDCLFLNVQVPEGVKAGDNVPVIHWIHGSAYSYGSKDHKDTTVDPEGLFNNLVGEDEKFIFVASNYRLGLYGWMSSPKENSMDANIGLHDSITALEWTREHISKFGGDPGRVTVIGEGSGGAIVNMMLTANGGRGDLPFSQAIVLSPELMPRIDVDSRREKVYDEVLRAADCTSLDCLREATPDVLKSTNNRLISDEPSGTGGGSFGPGIGFSPVVDGDILPNEPMVLLKQGRYHKEVKQVLTSNMAYDGKGAVSDRNMPGAFPDMVRVNFPGASDKTIKSIEALLPYPPGFPQKLAWDWITSIIYACHSNSIAKAYGDKARRYVMTAPPATHGLDLPYLFFVNDSKTPVSNRENAWKLQSYLYRFIQSKDGSSMPPPAGLAHWPTYGDGFNTLDIGQNGAEFKADPWETTGICPALLELVLNPKNGH